VALALVSVAAAAAAARADVVVRHDGSSIEGRVVSVDAEAVVVESGGSQSRLAREEVAEIRFGPVAPILRVEMRNIESDDSLDVFLEDEAVLREGRRGGEWIDLTPKLKDGNNAMRFQIRNDRGTWAYRLALRLNGETTILACGTPHRVDDPCREFGHRGNEIGRIDLPPFWIHVDRRAGRAEVLR
jgi:hypothetical protein